MLKNKISMAVGLIFSGVMLTNVAFAQDAAASNPNTVFNQDGSPMPPQSLSGVGSGFGPNLTNMDKDDKVTEMFYLLNAENKRLKEMQKEVTEKMQVMSTPLQTPESASSHSTINLQPGSVAPVVRVFLDRPTSIVINDITGAPWPIENFDAGNTGKKLTVARLDGPQGSVLSVTPKEAYVNSIISLKLKDLVTPVAVELVSGQKKYDTRNDVRVLAKGPNTQIVGVGLPNELDNKLFSVLYGTPSDAKLLKVSSPYAQAWLSKDGKMYLRTRMKVLAPAFENVTSSPDGTYAYKLPASPVVSYKNNGQMGEFLIEGF